MNAPLFTPEQQKMLEAAAGLVVLLACWQCVKTFHPWWRDGRPLNYTSVGVAILLVLAVVDFVLMAYFFDVVRHHPLVLPSLAMAGCFAVLVGDRVDYWRRTKLEAEKPKAELPKLESSHSEERLINVGVWYARLLAVSLVATLLSFLSSLVGPKLNELLPFGAVLLAVGVLLMSKQPMGIRFRGLLPKGLSSRFNGLQKWQTPLQRALLVAGICTFGSIPILFLTTWGAGSPREHTPIFAPHEKYLFSERGVVTEVSPVRYWVAGTAQVTSLHGAATLVTLLALHALMFGRIPEEMLKQLEERSKKLS